MSALYKRIVTQEAVPIPTNPVVTFELSADGPTGDGSISTATIVLPEGTTELTASAPYYYDFYGFCRLLSPIPYVYWQTVTNTGPTELYEDWRVGDEYNFNKFFDLIRYSEVPIYDNNGFSLYTPTSTEEVEGWRRSSKGVL